MNSFKLNDNFFTRVEIISVRFSPKDFDIFTDEDYNDVEETRRKIRCLRLGEIANNDWGSCFPYNGKHIYEYDLWMHMLERSLSEDKKVVNKSYRTFLVPADWLSMRAFINDVSPKW